MNRIQPTRHAATRFSLPFATALCAMLCAAGASAQDADIAAVTARMRAAFPGMPAQARMEATVVPGIYAMRAPGFAGCSVFTNADVSMVANNGKRGWYGVASKKPIDESASRELMASIYRALPPGLVPAGKGKDSGMVLISGADCGTSASTEAALDKQHVTYRIVPTAINRANLPVAQAAACAADPRAAWSGLRRGQEPARTASNGACPVDMAALNDISCMLMGGRLPTALFPDGRFSHHPNEIEQLVAASR